MKIQRLKAALAKAQAQVVKTERTVKSATALATSLKINLRDAKRAFKESRRTFKHVRRFFRTATREQRDAEKAFKKASAHLQKLQAKTRKTVPKSKPSKKKAGATQSVRATRAKAEIAPALVVATKPATIRTSQEARASV